jgi:YD repeat-containing protein
VRVSPFPLLLCMSYRPYDAADAPTGHQYQDGTRVTNTYDANSQRTVLSDLTGSYTSTYDPDGRVSSVINPAGIAAHVILG